MDALIESGAVSHTLQMIDGTVARAHHQAAGARGRAETGFWPLPWRPHDQDPPHCQRRRFANENGNHVGLGGLI